MYVDFFHYQHEQFDRLRVGNIETIDQTLENSKFSKKFTYSTLSSSQISKISSRIGPSEKIDFSKNSPNRLIFCTRRDEFGYGKHEFEGIFEF